MLPEPYAFVTELSLYTISRQKTLCFCLEIVVLPGFFCKSAVSRKKFGDSCLEIVEEVKEGGKAVKTVKSGGRIVARRKNERGRGER